ncbi:MAG TPA: CBS domain-containing protein [Vicinamibacterales bacterium]|nr:CBS domain-containing protein [Vicinamibacterales bacterium]
MKPVGAVIRDQELAVVGPDTSVFEAVQLMAARQIGAVPVVDGERLVGIFTERDLMARVVASSRDPARTTIRDVMSTDLVVADAAEAQDACLRRMQQARVRHLLVLREGRLTGIVSLRDLLAAEIDDREDTIKLLNAYVHYIPVDLNQKT